MEPGHRLAGRYRLSRPAAGGAAVPRASDGPLDGAGARRVLSAVLPAAQWQGHDEVLGRPVGVRVMPADDPVADAVLDAARRAATLDDPRFVAVLDADRSEGLAYVVTEWVEARDLTALLSSGPLTDLEAQGLAAELARALAAAHRAGLTHGRLLPESVLVTDAGRLKVAGLAVSAAAHGAAPGDPHEEDVRGAGAVLYAALTGRWPLPGTWGATSLPPAPLAGGEVCTPRQVRAAVPADLDEVACRALGVHLRRDGLALSSLDDLAALLPPVGAGADSATGPLPVVPTDPGLPLLSAPPGGRSTARRALSLAVGCVLAGATSLLGYQVVTGLPDAQPPEAPSPRAPAPSAAASLPAGALPAGLSLPVREVTAFDPQGDGTEHDDRAQLAVDGDAGTSWTTQLYYNDPLGGLKDGVGLVVDLGAQRSVGAVTLELDGQGSDVELRAAPADDDAEPPEDPEDFRPVARTVGAAGRTTLSPERAVDARYLLVWFTDLPAVGEAEFRGGVAELAVRS